MQKTVLVVQRRLTHYRVPFFEVLRDELNARGIRLILAHGSPSSIESTKNDEGTLSWAHQIPTNYALNGRLCWQSCNNLLPGIDMVVLTHENKLLYNIYMQYFRKDIRLALWGHGANLQGNQKSFKELFKQKTAQKADWWFAYTEASVNLIERSGFPKRRIQVLNNSIDTLDLQKRCSIVTADTQEILRQKLGLSGSHVCVFIGSLYLEKRIDFLLEAAARIKHLVPEFELLVIGSGPLESQIKRFSDQNSWLHYVGSQRGQDKVNMMSLARAVIIPGAVGLTILDSFVVGAPIITTDRHGHGPEISYLENDHNGIMTADSIEEYSHAVKKVLTDQCLAAHLRKGCFVSAQKYTIESMAKNFADGVENCLSTPLYR